ILAQRSEVRRPRFSPLPGCDGRSGEARLPQERQGGDRLGQARARRPLLHLSRRPADGEEGEGHRRQRYPPVVRGQRRVGARSQAVRYAEARRRGHEVFRRVLRPGQRQGAQEKRVRIATSLQRASETSLWASRAARLGRDAPVRLGAGRLASHRSLSMSDFAAARWIRAEAVARLSRHNASAIRMPRELYTSPEFFELERDRVLAGTWVCVGITGDLAHPGDLLPYDLAGIPLLLLRDRAGTVRAFHNVCSHRGVQLVAERRNTRGGITCPYH